MRERRFDVVIAGSGPAGSTTALRLAREGFSVALVESRRFPRFKACGEFLSPDCLPMLDELGLGSSLADLGARPVRSMLLAGHGRRARGRFREIGRARVPGGSGWAVRRERFDELLQRAALRTGGVELFEAWRATGLLRGAGGAVEGLVAESPGTGAVRLRARFTIGADGLRSRVAGELGVRRPIAWLDKVALTTRYAGVEWGDAAEVHFLERGYIVCAPVDGGLVTLNLVIDRELLTEKADGRDELLERWIARVPELAARLARGRRVDPVRGLGPLGHTTRAQTFDGAALVGDACGYVDPVTGEGIWIALKGAQMLSASVARALHAGRADRAALADYLAGRRREIAPRAALALLLQRGLRAPRVVRAALALLEARPGVADLLVSVTGDYVPASELARPSVWLGAIGPRRRSAEGRRAGGAVGA